MGVDGGHDVEVLAAVRTAIGGIAGPHASHADIIGCVNAALGAAGGNPLEQAADLPVLINAVKTSNVVFGANVPYSATGIAGAIAGDNTVETAIDDAFAHHSVTSVYTNLGANVAVGVSRVLGAINAVFLADGALNAGNRAVLTRLLDDAANANGGANYIRQATTLDGIKNALKASTTPGTIGGAAAGATGGFAGALSAAGTGLVVGVTPAQLDTAIDNAFTDGRVISAYNSFGANVAAGRLLGAIHAQIIADPTVIAANNAPLAQLIEDAVGETHGNNAITQATTLANIRDALKASIFPGTNGGTGNAFAFTGGIAGACGGGATGLNTTTGAQLTTAIDNAFLHHTVTAAFNKVADIVGGGRPFNLRIANGLD